MLGRIAALGVPCLLGSYLFLRQNPITLTNPHLAQILTLANNYNPQYSILLFKAFLKLRLLAPDQALSKYILKSGFDVDGRFINQIRYLGFRGIELGPISFNPTLTGQQPSHLGIVSALARICSYVSSNNRAQSFQVQLNIVPNLQVLKFAPYLTKENIMQSLTSFAQIQKLITKKIVSRINIDFDHREVKLQATDTPEVQKMIKETKSEATALIKQLSDKLQTQIQFQVCPKRIGSLDWPALLAYINQQNTI